MALSNLTKVQTLGIGSNIEVVGVITTGQFKSGTSNLHSTGVELTNLNVSGIATIGGNLSIGGTLTYQDVTNIDSVGLITARAGVNVSGGQLDVGSNIKIGNAGVITATSFSGNGAALTGIDATAIKDTGGNVKIQAQASGAVYTGIHTFNSDIDVDGHTNLDNTDIVGILTVTSTTQYGGYKLSNNSSIVGELVGLSGSNDTGALALWSGGSKYVQLSAVGNSYLNGGNIGMGGNTNPTNVLHIKTAVTNTAVATIESTATNSYPFLRLKNDAREYQLTCHGGLSDAFTIYDGTSSAHRFLIDSSGRVLINTTNNSNGHIAASNLAVQGGDLSIFKDSGGDNAGVSGHKLKFVTQSGSLGEIDVLSEGGGGPSGRGGSMRFYIKENNTASAVERMRLTSTGALRIERGSDSSNAIVINSTSTTDACRIKFDESGSTKAQITYSHDNDRLELVASSGNSIAFYSGGNLVSQIDTSGHFIPQTNNVHDLGSSSKRWRNVYTTDLQLSNKGKTNDVDNTWGDYTIQEGESELFLINNRNGKKYKFNLTEVS